MRFAQAIAAPRVFTLDAVTRPDSGDSSDAFMRQGDSSPAGRVLPISPSLSSNFRATRLGQPIALLARHSPAGPNLTLAISAVRYQRFESHPPPPVARFGTFLFTAFIGAESPRNAAIPGISSEPRAPADRPILGRFAPLCTHLLRHNRTTPVLVRLLEARKINRLDDVRRGVGLKEPRSGGVNRNRTVWFGTAVPTHRVRGSAPRTPPCQSRRGQSAP